MGSEYDNVIYEISPSPFVEAGYNYMCLELINTCLLINYKAESVSPFFCPSSVDTMLV